MNTLLVFLGLVAMTYATAHECGPLQRLKVKHQWAEAYGIHGIHREELGREIWLYIFEHEPKAVELFTRVRGDNVFSPEFTAHMSRVLGGLDMVISLLTDADTLSAQLAHLQSQHKERNIPSEYFDVMERAIHTIVPHHVSHHVHFDQDAWDACFEVIAAGIKSA